ncbi:MAG: ABC transporter substrate-binding protein [Chloroflexales bacterium]|nr:ABC transporter substrate-binding protein [Chloroflexales bacterium]
MVMTRKSPFIVIMLLVSMILVACGGGQGGAATGTDTQPTQPDAPPATGDQPFAGTTVTIFGAYTEPGEVDVFEAGFEPFEAETGIDVQYEGASDFETLIATRVEGNNPPDIAGFPQPGLMNRFADQAVDLSQFLEQDYLEQQYDPGWIVFGTTAEGKLIGIVNRAVVKSLVWYSPQYFNEAGYTIPATWDEMIALSDQMVADGNTPWYAPMESGQATGWVGTDWIEDIMLRTTMLENYDKWTIPANPDDRLLFASPEVKNAFEQMGTVLLNEDYMFGGTLTTLRDRFFDTGKVLLNGEAYLAKQGSYMPGWLADDFPDLTIGPEGDLNYFLFPEIDPQYGSPILVGGDVYSMFNDRPEVREVIRYMTTAQSIKPAVETGVFIAPHKDVDPSWATAEFRGIAEILLNADAVRFDGSDLMPGQVGAGTFWSGVVDYISGDDLDPLLTDIDASWPQ